MSILGVHEPVPHPVFDYHQRIASVWAIVCRLGNCVAPVQPCFKWLHWFSVSMSYAYLQL